MVFNDLAGTQLRCLFKGHFLLGPGRAYLPGRIIFHQTQRSFHHVSHTVHQPKLAGCVAGHFHSDGLGGNKLHLCGHNGAASRRLGQLVLHPFTGRRVLQSGQHQKIHKPADQCGFTGSDRTHNADLQLPAGAPGDLFIYIIIGHGISPLPDSFACEPSHRGILYIMHTR